MSVLSMNQKLTLFEAMKEQGYEDLGSMLADVAQQNDMLDDFIWLPSSHGAYHQSFKARSLGKGAFGKANGAVPVISSAGDMDVEPVKLYSGDSHVDEIVFKGVLDPYKVRDAQDGMNLEGCMDDWLYNLIYSVLSANPDGFKGMAARRAAINSTNCFDFGGTASGALSSGWLIEHGKRGFWLAYPPNGGPPAFSNEDRGLISVPAPDGNGNHWVWARHFEIMGALVEGSIRGYARLANINPAGGTGDFSSAPFLKAKRWQPSGGRLSVAYFTRNVAARIDEFCASKSNGAYTIKDIEGYGPMSAIYGVPVRVIDAGLETESRLT